MQPDKYEEERHLAREINRAFNEKAARNFARDLEKALAEKEERFLKQSIKRAFAEAEEEMITQEQIDRIMEPIRARIYAGDFDRKPRRKDITIITLNLRPDPTTNITQITLHYPI